MWGPFFQGFGVSGGLIIAIGAQNAFVLSQAVKKNYHLLVALICSVCDAILITAGISGIGTVAASNPHLAKAVAWGGALFLAWYGWKAFQSARRGGTLDADSGGERSLRAAVLTTLAVTWLNPHCYLDSVLLIGSIGGQFSGDSRLFFGVGAVSASFAWFFSLSLFGRMLAPVFQKPAAWQILDGLVCIVMWSIAVSLVV